MSREIRLYNANIKKKKGNTAAEYGVRVKNVAELMAKKDNQRHKAANLFAIVEAYYGGSGWWTRHHKKQTIPCGMSPFGTGPRITWTHECLYDNWRISLDRKLGSQQIGFIGEQYGDVAVLASKSDFECVSGTGFIKRTIGPGGWWRLQYKIIGVRLKSADTQSVLPFYAVHFNTKQGGEGRQEESAGDVVRIVKNNQIEGDSAPVIVGDFNFNSSDTPYSIMSKDFYEVGMIHGRDDIEHVWVGRDSSFRAFAGIDAALLYSNGKAYFFKGGQYIRYTPGIGVDPGYAKSIVDHWNRWPDTFTNVDAALLYNNGKAYFFKGDRYIRYTPGEGVDPRYPKRIVDHWKRWPSDFTSIGAALLYSNGKVYFFNGDQYIRYTPGEGVDPGYPKRIVDHWRRWPSDFTSIDAALLYNNGKAYFFKGDRYIRYTPGEGVDPGYPKRIIDRWIYWPKGSPGPKPIAFDPGDEFIDGADALTDHNIPYVELVLPS